MPNIIKPKRSNTAAKVPNTTELTSGELGVNMADRKVYINNGTAVVQVGAGNLSGLGDVAIASPSNGQALTYNSTTSKWQNSSAGAGTVTSVGITPGTGVTVSNSPITTSGNIAVGLSTKLTAIENLSGAGFITQNGTGVIAGRTLQAGTGISIAHGNGSSQDPIITNSAPDQTVALTGAGATTISGTYPNFTISSVNTTYGAATSTVPGLIELGSDTAQTVAANAVSATASRSYALQVNAAGQGVVNVPWTDTNSGGTVTSVAVSGGTTGLTTSGGPVTTSGTITLAGTLAVANGGTGATTAAAARTNLGATTLGGNLYTLANVAAIAFPRFNADNTVSSLDAASFRTAIGAGTSSTTGTVTSVGGTGTVSGLTLTGTVTTSGNLTLGGTLAVTPSNFASQTANTFLAAPNGAAGVPTFRAMVAADVPTLNQNTTGTAANVTGTVAIANGGTGQTTRQNAMDALAGAVTSGQYLRGNGTDVVMSAIQAADVPTLNQSTTGNAATATTATNVSGGTASVTTLTVNSNNISAVNSFGFRNRIINGDMRIDQRNNGASVTLANAANTFPVDRFQFYKDNTSATVTGQQSSVAPTGFNNSLLVSVTTGAASSAAQELVMYQNIEGFNVADLGFGAAGVSSITLSFWVRSSLTGTFAGAFANSGSSRTYIFTYTVSAANTWEQKTITVPGDTTGTWQKTNGNGLSIKFDLGSGSNYNGTAGSWTTGNIYSVSGATKVMATTGATFYITGAQLEAGSVATPFERRDYGRELMMCQRYYWVGQVIVETSASITGFNFPVDMRATPTVTGGSTGFSKAIGGTNGWWGFQNIRSGQTLVAQIEL